VQDEHGAAIEIEAIQREQHELSLPFSVDQRIRALASILELGSRLVDDLAPGLAPVVRGHAEAKREEPGLDRAARIVLVELAVDGQEDLVSEILDVALCDAEPAQRAEDVRELELEQGPKIDRRGARLRDGILDNRTSHVCLTLVLGIHRQK
jgi:hypothetical protein